MMKGYHLTLALILSAFGIGSGALRYEDGQTIEEEYPNYDVGYVSHCQLFAEFIDIAHFKILPGK